VCSKRTNNNVGAEIVGCRSCDMMMWNTRTVRMSGHCTLCSSHVTRVPVLVGLLVPVPVVERSAGSQEK
jgi:hypothetical protein